MDSRAHLKALSNEENLLPLPLLELKFLDRADHSLVALGRSISTQMCVCVCMYVRMYVYMYFCIYVYLCIYACM
jgi:hypothetical protein